MIRSKGGWWEHFWVEHDLAFDVGARGWGRRENNHWIWGDERKKRPNVGMVMYTEIGVIQNVDNNWGAEVTEVRCWHVLVIAQRKAGWYSTRTYVSYAEFRLKISEYESGHYNKEQAERQAQRIELHCMLGWWENSQPMGRVILKEGGMLTLKHEALTKYWSCLVSTVL